jgi:hypothetical protein
VAIAAVAFLSQSTFAAPIPDAGSAPPQRGPSLFNAAQLPRYTASGLHQCGAEKGEERTCVVTGLFRDCNEAAMSLRTRDCCPTTKGGGKSRAFSLSYCIPDYSGR